jgi:hypothetical protein
MYYYLSFLRPPPSSIDIAVPSGGITITPQIANDLRTECVSRMSYHISRVLLLDLDR